MKPPADSQAKGHGLVTTLTADACERLGLFEAPTPPPRRLDDLRDIPDLHDQHREALARIPTPIAPEG